MDLKDIHSAAGHLLDITQHEIEALKTKYNLADAHTHQRQSPSQHEILRQLPSIWYEAEEKPQAEFEQRFIQAFFELHKQPTALKKNKTLLSYAASISTIVAGLYMQQRNMSVTLIEPCFDNLHDILKSMGIKRNPIHEDVLSDPSKIYQRLKETVHTEALFLVDPNNPTGFTMLKDGRKGFEEVVRFCKDHNKLLVIDLCFASFALMDKALGRFDIYELLEDSGVSYIVIEDTGKTWPVQDAKCALLTASDDVHKDLYNIQTVVLLNVSPFVLNMLSRYLRDSLQDGFASVRDVLETNRTAARKALDGSILDYVDPIAKVSVGWFRIKPPDLTASELQRVLREHEVYVLPGTYFFWNEPKQGERFVRVALAREPKVFAEAVKRMREVLDRYAQR